MQQQQSQDEQKRLLLAVALCAGVLAIWSYLFPQKAPVDPAKKPDTQATEVSSKVEVADKLAQAAEAKSKPTIKIEKKTLAVLRIADLEDVELSNDDGQISAWILEEEQYRVRGDGKATSPYRFVDAFDPESSRGRFLPPRLDLSLSGVAARGEYTKVSNNKKAASLNWIDPVSGIEVVRSYEFASDAYTVRQRITLHNPTSAEVPYDLTAVLRAAQNNAEATGSMFMPPLYKFEGVCQRAEGDFERMQIEKIAEATNDPDEPTSFSDAIWAGVDSRYFMTAALVADGEIERCLFKSGAETEAEQSAFKGKDEGFGFVTAQLELTGGVIPPNGSVERSITFYAGPKKLDVLATQTPKLSKAINFGFFTVISRPMLWLMRWFFNLTGNWGFAIILLTLLVKLLTFPLTHKQYKSMASMKVLQPKMKALQEKYKDDKPKQQQELMALYRENNVNPLAGCLPLVLMMPIYFSLYRTIYSAVELYQAEFMLWITDLSNQDPYYIIPLALGVLMFIQTRLNPNAGGDQTQQKIIMWVMPFMFTGMMLFLPSGLVIYIFVNTTLGIAQQYWLLKNVGAQSQGVTSKA